MRCNETWGAQDNHRMVKEPPCIDPTPVLYSYHPARLRGALMRRLERGAGRRRDRRTGPQTPAAGARQFRALVGAAPADEARTLVLGRRRGSARRYYGLLPGAG